MDQVNEKGATITLIHFTFSLENRWRIACMPGKVDLHTTEGHENYHRSNDIRAVTCPVCKRMQAGGQTQKR